MASQPSLEALVASKAAKARKEAGEGSEAPSGPNMFMGIDLNQVAYNENGEATYGGLPGSGAVVLNSVGIVPFPKSKKPIPRDPIPVTQEVREVLIKKKGKFGLTLRNFEHGVFVSHVREKSSAAKAGIRFGDQVLKIEDLNVAGMKGKEAFDYALGLPNAKVSFIIRDRPLERVVDLMRNDQGHVGLLIVDGEIRQVQGESSAENNGVVIHSQICEINGINALGVPDEKIAEIIKDAESPTIRFTIIPRKFYVHLTKRLGSDEFGVFHRAKPEPLEP
ncbi:unnamed protein product [Hymenolepis diminuta]|uniref:PDZ domain-containing protein n=1 Tax=Hymenolepis diminuta TaxID=6216 RepID=A0A564YSX1_HYMDI|nr:unnamed protein product [Hymenolepis diminuta]